jgi:hypothetical protein
MMEFFNGIDWMNVAVWPLVIIAGGFAIKWLQRMSAKAAENLKSDKLSGMDYLKTQVMSSLSMVAANIANSELKKLKEASSDGKVDKEELAKLKSHAIHSVKEEFKAQGRDLTKELGPVFMDEALRFVVDKFNKENPEEAPKVKKKSKKKS